MSSGDGRGQSIEPRDIESLVELFDASDWDELHLQIGGVELFLSTDPRARATSLSAAPRDPAVEPVAPHAAALSAALRDPAVEPVAAHWVAVTAPNLGTFYRAPKPGAAPFVELGQPVRPDTELCLIEVMKLFTTVTSGVAGVVRTVCVQDADMVEFGDTLFYIEPA